jgi:hypothetical protein
MSPIDDGHAIHHSELKRGTPVYSSDEVVVGEVLESLDNFRENIFDGLVIRTQEGEQRFVDAPEVARTAERAVTLTINAAEVEHLDPPPKRRALGARRGGGLGRLFGRR